VRLFVAVIPPDAVQRAAHDAAARLARPHDGVGWVKRENLHFTLRFLGEVDDPAPVAAAADEAAAAHPSFEAELGGAGAFPSPRRARVLWLAMARGGDALKAVAQALDRALVARGFPAADRPFAPHLTIGRVREPREDWSERVADTGAMPRTTAFRVDRIAVVQSRRQRGGSVCGVQHEALRGG
jgi:2'-5' RNA ligase